MKKLVYALVVVVLLLSVVNACARPVPVPTPTPTPTPTPPAKPIKMKFAVYWVEPLVYSSTIKWWVAELEKRSKGRVDVELYWASVLGPATQQLDIIGTGIAEVGVVGMGYFPSQLPLSGGLELPYLATSLWVQTKAIEDMYGTSAKLRKEFQQNNVLYMANVMSGSEPVILSNKPVKTLEDLKGLKIRAYGRLSWVYNRLGATPVAIAFADIYTAMQRGTLDAATGVAPGGIYGAKLNEVAQYVTLAGLGCFVFNAIVMNLDFWYTLPEDIKEIIQQLNADVADQSPALIAKPEFDALKQLRGEGKTVSVLPPAEIKRWKDMVVPALYDAWVEEMTKAGVAGAAEFLKEYQGLIEKYKPADKWPKFE